MYYAAIPLILLPMWLTHNPSTNHAIATLTLSLWHWMGSLGPVTAGIIALISLIVLVVLAIALFLPGKRDWLWDNVFWIVNALIGLSALISVARVWHV